MLGSEKRVRLKPVAIPMSGFDNKRWKVEAEMRFLGSILVLGFSFSSLASYPIWFGPYSADGVEISENPVADVSEPGVAIGANFEEDQAVFFVDEVASGEAVHLRLGDIGKGQLMAEGYYSVDLADAEGNVIVRQIVPLLLDSESTLVVTPLPDHIDGWSRVYVRVFVELGDMWVYRPTLHTWTSEMETGQEKDPWFDPDTDEREFDCQPVVKNGCKRKCPNGSIVYGDRCNGSCVFSEQCSDKDTEPTEPVEPDEPIAVY